MAKKTQSKRLSKQHKESKGAVGVFGDEAKKHDKSVFEVASDVFVYLEKEYPSLEFRHRTSITKQEINTFLNSIDCELGVSLYNIESSIKPDGGIIEVKDDNGEWRIILVSEAKFQGKDIENIKKGVLVGKNKDQDVMVAGNAIERAHKNIKEIANFMLYESHFPYVMFIEGSNFLTENISVARPDGRVVTLIHNSGSLNRLDRLTAANYSMPFNKNLCKNKFIFHGHKCIMLQAASIYTHGDGRSWQPEEMFDIMVEISNTSLKMLGTDLFNLLTN